MTDFKEPTAEDLEKRRKENAAATQEAHRLAQAHIDDDKRAGRPSTIQEKTAFELKVIQEGLKAQIEAKFPSNGGANS